MLLAIHAVAREYRISPREVEEWTPQELNDALAYLALRGEQIEQAMKKASAGRSRR